MSKFEGYFSELSTTEIEVIYLYGIIVTLVLAITLALYMLEVTKAKVLYLRVITLQHEKEAMEETICVVGSFIDTCRKGDGDIEHLIMDDASPLHDLLRKEPKH